MTNEILALVTAVVETANNSYNLSFGWSEIVECWTRKEIAEELSKEKIDTKEAAINHFAWIAEIRSEYASEIESTVW
jgi:alpha-galactosidase/6-phospho-beta-glucosidase family protein